MVKVIIQYDLENRHSTYAGFSIMNTRQIIDGWRVTNSINFPS